MQRNVTKINKNEQGFILIGTLLVLVAVTAIAATLMTVSSFEVDMSTNEKCKEIARYNGESCSMATAKLVRMIVEKSKEGVAGFSEGAVEAPAIIYAEPASGTDKGEEFARKVMGFMGYGDDQICEDCQLELPPGSKTLVAGANVIPIGPESTRGAAAEVQSGGYAYGLGTGAAGGGGITLWYLIACRGDACNNAARHVTFSRYRKPLGIYKGE